MSVTTEELNPDFLPLIYDIIRSIEKDTHDNPAQKILMPQQSSSDVNAKMAQLKDLFAEFRATVPKLPGSGTSKEEQLQVLMSLRQQLIMKKELLMKYKNNSIFDNLNKQQLIQQQAMQHQSSYSGIGGLDAVGQ